MTTVTEIDRAQAQEMADQGALLIDVREDDEWAAGHVAGSEHQPLGGFDPAAVPTDRDVVMVCRSGNRSGKAAARLAEAGHPSVHNMAGGLMAWSSEGRPLVVGADA